MTKRDIAVRIGDWFFKYRNMAFPAVLVALLAGLRPVPLFGDQTTEIWLDITGVLIAALGSGLRAWVIGLAYIKRGGLNKKVYADTLISNGMFAVCRNPLYVGNALILLGFFLVHNHPYVYLAGIPFFGFTYWCIIAAEERFLAAKFDDEYRDYCGRVNRFIPSFSDYREATADMRFNWRRVVIKDYSSIYIWVTGMILLTGYEGAIRQGKPVDLVTLSHPLLAVALATAVMAGIRFLKKRRILTESPAG